MGHREARPHHELGDKVAVADSPEAVFCNRLEAELFAEELAVHEEGIAGEGATSEREDGDAWNELLQAIEVIVERKCMREKEVRPANRLTSLQIAYEWKMSPITRNLYNKEIRTCK